MVSLLAPFKDHLRRYFSHMCIRTSLSKGLCPGLWCPTGVFLGPRLFSLYITPLGCIFRHYGISFSGLCWWYWAVFVPLTGQTWLPKWCCSVQDLLRAVPEIILMGVGRRHFFVLWWEGVLLTTCPRGGGGNLSWGSNHIWSIVGRVN